MSVQVRDTGNPFKSSVTTLIIAVTDEDDSDPVFQHDIYEITVMENATGSLNTSPAAILAYDQDFGINQTLAYSLQEASAIPTDLSDLLDYFSIDGQTGELSLVRGLDREVVHDVTLIIKAEQANNNVRSAEARVYIVVQDANDNRPEMSASQYQATVVENAPSGSPVLTVTASDKDEGGNAMFMYVLEPSAAFTIDGTTGQVTVSNSSILDRETNNEFTLQVYVVETNTTEKYRSPTSTVLITLLDENDNNPTFTAEIYHANVAQDAANGAVLTQVVATDPDSGSNGEIRYSIIFASDNGKDKFTISADGNITVSGRLDANTVDSYVLVIMAADRGTASRETTAVVIINVINVNSTNEGGTDTNAIIIAVVVCVVVVLAIITTAVVLLKRRRAANENPEENHSSNMELENVVSSS
ncbi:protocadherin-1-like [Branchiostoma floridae x Branchiostoma japonicum]